MRRAALLSIVLLALAGCGSGGGHSASSTSPASSNSKGPDRQALVELCTTYCQPLEDQQKACPTGTTNLTACGMPLAAGADKVTAVQTGVNTFGAQPGVDLTPVITAIAKAQAAFDTWTNDSGCRLVYDLNSQELARIFPTGHDGMFTCAAEAATVGYTQASVGATLRNAAVGT